MSDSNQPTSYKQAFETLKTNAELLEQQTEPDIDQLLGTVETSVEAFMFCKGRIMAVEAALKDAFSALDS